MRKLHPFKDPKRDPDFENCPDVTRLEEPTAATNAEARDCN